MGDVVKANVVIVGSGPAGWTAALYASRANLEPVLFEGQDPGGQLMITTEVENYPGFPDGIKGPELMKLFKAQSVRFGTQVHSDVIVSIDFDAKPFRLRSGGGVEVEAKTIIISTGATARYLGIPGEDAFKNKGLSACAVCDGFFFRGKEVVVVGGGDSACEEASYLAKLCPKVTLIHRRDELRASKIMQQRVFDTANIEMRWNAGVEEYLGDANGIVRGVKVRDTVTDEIGEIPCQGAFIAIGHKPNTELFVDKLDMDKAGYLITAPDSTKTNIAGVFACGDVQDKTYRQAITAAGTGCMAALDAERWLAAQGH